MRHIDLYCSQSSGHMPVSKLDTSHSPRLILLLFPLVALSRPYDTNALMTTADIDSSRLHFEGIRNLTRLGRIYY